MKIKTFVVFLAMLGFLFINFITIAQSDERLLPNPKLKMEWEIQSAERFIATSYAKLETLEVEASKYAKYPNSLEKEAYNNWVKSTALWYSFRDAQRSAFSALRVYEGFLLSLKSSQNTSGILMLKNQEEVVINRIYLVQDIRTELKLLMDKYF